MRRATFKSAMEDYVLSVINSAESFLCNEFIFCLLEVYTFKDNFLLYIQLSLFCVMNSYFVCLRSTHLRIIFVGCYRLT